MGNENIEPEKERNILKRIQLERKKKIDKRQKKFQEQDLIFHYSFVCPHLLKKYMVCFGWMKPIRVLCYRRKRKAVSQRGGD